MICEQQDGHKKSNTTRSTPTPCNNHRLGGADSCYFYQDCITDTLIKSYSKFS